MLKQAGLELATYQQLRRRAPRKKNWPELAKKGDAPVQIDLPDDLL